MRINRRTSRSCRRTPAPAFSPWPRRQDSQSLKLSSRPDASWLPSPARFPPRAMHREGLRMSCGRCTTAPSAPIPFRHRRAKPHPRPPRRPVCRQVFRPSSPGTWRVLRRRIQGGARARRRRRFPKRRDGRQRSANARACVRRVPCSPSVRKDARTTLCRPRGEMARGDDPHPAHAHIQRPP